MLLALLRRCLRVIGLPIYKLLIVMNFEEQRIINYEALRSLLYIGGGGILVYQWIDSLIIRNLDVGEMEKAMIEYNTILQILAINFPFPYAQGKLCSSFI
jgi:hypothetical protein